MQTDRDKQTDTDRQRKRETEREREREIIKEFESVHIKKNSIPYCTKEYKAHV